MSSSILCSTSSGNSKILERPPYEIIGQYIVYLDRHSRAALFCVNKRMKTISEDAHTMRAVCAARNVSIQRSFKIPYTVKNLSCKSCLFLLANEEIHRDIEQTEKDLQAVPKDLLSKLTQDITFDLGAGTAEHRGKVTDTIKGLEFQKDATFYEVSHKVNHKIQELMNKINVYARSHPNAISFFGFIYNPHIRNEVVFERNAIEARYEGLIQYAMDDCQLHHLNTLMNNRAIHEGRKKLNKKLCALVKERETLLHQDEIDPPAASEMRNMELNFELTADPDEDDEKIISFNENDPLEEPITPENRNPKLNFALLVDLLAYANEEDEEIIPLNVNDPPAVPAAPETHNRKLNFDLLANAEEEDEKIISLDMNEVPADPAAALELDDLDADVGPEVPGPGVEDLTLDDDIFNAANEQPIRPNPCKRALGWVHDWFTKG